MTAQCTAAQDCHWHQISHNSKDNTLADSLSIYKYSTFCLCPPGIHIGPIILTLLQAVVLMRIKSIDQDDDDQECMCCNVFVGDDPARKAVFDSIVSGCIPVIFEVATLYNQYPWHLSEEEALDISVSVPGHLVRSNSLQFMEFLRKIPAEVYMHTLYICYTCGSLMRYHYFVICR